MLKTIFNFKSPAPRPCPTRTALCHLPKGCWAVIAALDAADQALAPLAELGFVVGARIRATHCGPSGDPAVYEIDGVQVALRRAASQRIWVEAPDQHAGGGR